MKHICANCGFVIDPKTHTKGDTGIELILWLCCLLPGVIYSLWRLSSRDKVCPACGSEAIVGTDTPRGQMLLKQFGPPKTFAVNSSSGKGWLWVVMFLAGSVLLFLVMYFFAR